MSTRGPVVALGSFDGVHCGHREILATAGRIAAELDAPTAVLTCYPLPAQLVHPDFTCVLTPPAEKTELLVELGIDFVHVLRFDEHTRRTEPEEFVRREILELNPVAVVAGHDHRFGRSARGDVALLRELLEPAGVRVAVVPEFTMVDAPVRSTRIRERLLLGHVRRATELLGRPYRLNGPVVSGTATGRRIGFPTINLQVAEKEKLIPADGVYAVRVSFDGRSRPAVLNIGHRPTFRGETRTIETHVLDTRLAHSPAAAAVDFIDRLRPERRFPDPAELARQIEIDARRARALLNESDCNA